MKKLLAILLAFALAAPAAAQEFTDADEEDIFEDEEEYLPDDELDQYEDYVEPGREDEEQAEIFDRVKSFDIAGIALGQDYQKVREAMKARKFRITDVEYKIPEYFSFNYDATCREKNMLVPETLSACITGMAKKDKTHHVARAQFSRPDTNEKINVFFTSPITEHKVWKIEYSNDIDKKYGDAKNFQYQREERRRAFWYDLTNKYGEPNVEPNQWLLDPGAELIIGMTAEFGRLTLENQQQNSFDILEGQKEARRRFKYKEYSF